MNVSLVYNNKKLIGKCSKFAIEKVQGTSPFVMLENFEPKQPQLNENQQIVVNDVKQDHENYGIPKFSAIHLAFTTYATGYYKDHLKNDEEFYQVLRTLIAWAQEQEEE
ncbi:hypothetical protein ACOYX4_13595 [Enterococcus entomosocium]|uniref:hypothetical protein n=1 Tax=Enterococcus entomosocium TaxID=3034352 RepID=UPI003BC71107